MSTARNFESLSVRGLPAFGELESDVKYEYVNVVLCAWRAARYSSPNRYPRVLIVWVFCIRTFEGLPNGEGDTTRDAKVRVQDSVADLFLFTLDV